MHMIKNRIIILPLLLLALLSCMFFLVNYLRKDYIINSLPEEAKLIDVYWKGLGGNGDYVYAMKAMISLSQFEEFAKNHGLSDEIVDPTTVIGYNPSDSDVPKTGRIDWDEPRHPERKYFKMDERNFVRVVYARGILYYYSRGW
jgi:hypothetical protein